MCWYNGVSNWLIPFQIQIHEYENIEHIIQIGVRSRSYLTQYFPSCIIIKYHMEERTMGLSKTFDVYNSTLRPWRFIKRSSQFYFVQPNSLIYFWNVIGIYSYCNEARWHLDEDNYPETLVYFTPPTCLKMAWLKILLHHPWANELRFWCGWDKHSLLLT